MARNLGIKLMADFTPFRGPGDTATNGDHISVKGFVIAVPDFRVDFVRAHAGIVGLGVYFRQLLQLCVARIADGNAVGPRPFRQGKLRLRSRRRGAGYIVVLGFGRLHHLAEGL